MRLLALSALALILTACGGRAKSSPEPASTGPPRQPPPTAGNLKGPPPAWVETARGPRWLGFSSFCWGTTCADFIPPRCGDERRTPTLHLRLSEVIRFHIGFAPTEVGLTGPDRRPHSLPASRTPTWRVDRAGTFSLFARAKANGDASYVACVRFS